MNDRRSDHDRRSYRVGNDVSPRSPQPAGRILSRPTQPIDPFRAREVQLTDEEQNALLDTITAEAEKLRAAITGAGILPSETDKGAAANHDTAIRALARLHVREPEATARRLETALAECYLLSYETRQQMIAVARRELWGEVDED